MKHLLHLPQTVLDLAWIQTHSGRKLSLIDPQPEDILIQDIAHHLSQINRYNGGAKFPYSVAQHSLLCSTHITPAYSMHALLHDAPEAYIQDIIRPLKRLLHDQYHPIEERFEQVIAEKFGLDCLMNEHVKAVDNRMGDTEARELLNKPPLWPIGEGYPFRLCQMEWHEAKAAFLRRFDEIGGQR